MKLAFRPAAIDEKRCLCAGSPADSDGCSFVVSTWSSSYKKSHHAGLIQSEDWAMVMHPQLTKRLAKPYVTTLLAYEKTDPTFLYGYIVGDVTEHMAVVDYVYVKEAFRREGIARALFGELGVDPSRSFLHTCKTPIVAELWKAGKLQFARLNNNAARYPKEARRDRWQTK